MKTAFILSFILLLLSLKANAQQTIDKLNANQLKLPKESTNKALFLDGVGQVKSSSTISDTELGYLEGLSDTLVNLLSGKAADSTVVKLTGDQSISGVKTFTGKLVAQSTINGSIPCPVMTEIQRDLFTPAEGDCVYNSDSLKLNVFDGSVWKDVGGAGGISLWLTANPYNVNDIVIESDKIYRCLIAHTSGTFATDLGAGNWGEVSQGLTSPVALADGGTGLSITPVAGSIVYVDVDSFEQLAPGSAGQILQSNGSSAPSWVNKSISAKAENGSSVTAEELQVSNNQLTQVDTNKHLIESGNNNLLVNPSFEHSTFSTGWTNSVGTFTEETVVEIHGKKAAKLVLSSQAMALTQDSSLYAAQFADGVQGLASVRVKSDVALKVCSRSAGVTSSSLCVDVQANNKWGLYKVPFILGATSNGISIASTGAVTGTVYTDDAFVGPADLTQNMNACNDVSCETEFSATISSSGVVSGENIDWINSNATITNTSTFTLSFNSSIFNQAPNCNVSILDNTTTNSRNIHILTLTLSSVAVRTLSSTDTPTVFPFQIICQKQGADFTAAKQLSNGNTYSSTNADTDWASCTPTSSQGFGTPTFAVQCKRHGGDLLMKGRFTPSTSTTVEARIGLPLWSGVQLLSAGSSIIPNLEAANGFYIRTASSATHGGSILIEPSVSYVTFGSAFTFSPTASVGLAKANGDGVAGGGETLSFNARIPIEGWQNSNILIGQFNGLESCTSTLDCTDVFSAKVSSTGVVTAENAEFLNGNCTVVTGTYTCNFNTSLFTVAPNCVASTNSSPAVAASGISVIGQTTSAVTVYTYDNVQTPRPFSLVCQKQGVDYIGKTAKAVASDQNVRSIGSTGMDLQSVYFGIGANCDTVCTTGTCNICHQVGSKITSVTFDSTGSYRLNGIDGTKYSCTGNGYNAGVLGLLHFRSSSTSTYAFIQYRSGNTATNSSYSSVICTGIP